MMDLGSLHGTALLQRGTDDLVAVADCTPGTRFQICSISKQFTTAGWSTGTTSPGWS